MQKNKIIAAASFSFKKYKKYKYYFPFSTIVHPKYRQKGYGTLLYKTLIYSINLLNINLKKILLAQHCAVETFTTSKGAEFIYDSLVKNSYLTFYKSQFIHKYSNLYKNLNPKIFLINNIPSYKHKLIQLDNNINIFRIYD